VPTFASGFVLGDYRSPKEVADEWLRGRTLQLPPVKMLERFYGSAKTAVVKGPSWRSSFWVEGSSSNKKDTAFSKRKVAFEYIEEHGEEAALAEMDRLMALCGDGKPSWRTMRCVLGEMRKTRKGAEGRSVAAAERAAVRASKHPRLSEPPQATP